MAVAHKCRDTIKTYFDTYVVEMRNNDGRVVIQNNCGEVLNERDIVDYLAANNKSVIVYTLTTGRHEISLPNHGGFTIVIDPVKDRELITTLGLTFDNTKSSNKKILKNIHKILEYYIVYYLPNSKLPKFSLGDTIINKGYTDCITYKNFFTISSITEDRYYANDGRYIEIKYQDEYRNIKDAVFSLKAGEE